MLRIIEKIEDIPRYENKASIDEKLLLNYLDPHCGTFFNVRGNFLFIKKYQDESCGLTFLLFDSQSLTFKCSL